jgi:UDP-N-acetylmuramoylalanine--D-glutamate ligase
VIRIATRTDRKLAVFGLGASGLAAARALAASGAAVTAWDDNGDQRRRAAESGLALDDLYSSDFSGIDALVLAPGIPYTHNAHPVVRRAQEAGCAITGDIELLLEACPDTRAIGITGTNGKSTTTSLVGHILHAAGRPAQVGGNLGPPALAFDMPEGDDATFVLELSSYQLDLTERAGFDIAVLINVSPDHLSRHGGMEGYVAAKKRIFRNHAVRERRQTAVIGLDDGFGRAICEEMSARPRWRCVPFSAESPCANGVSAAGGVLVDATGDEPVEICRLGGIPTLPGVHNWQNAAAAYAVARAAGVGRDEIAAALASYPGLSHRQELVTAINGVRYVNDSKATNGEAAARALACYDDIFWIAGGQPKEGGLDATIPWLNRVRHAYLIGEAEEAFAARLRGTVAVTRCGTLAAAVEAAHKAAQSAKLPGSVVLLSPACASFDQWKSFEARGDGFRTLVRELAMEAAT